PAPLPEQPDNVIRRELQLVGLYRMLEAVTLCLLLFGPVPTMLEARHPVTGNIAAAAYLLAAGAIYFAGRVGRPIHRVALAGALADVAAASLAMHAVPGAWAGIAMLLLFNIGAAALL